MQKWDRFLLEIDNSPFLYKEFEALFVKRQTMKWFADDESTADSWLLHRQPGFVCRLVAALL